MKKLILALGLSTALTATPALAQLGGWDADANAALTEQEWGAGLGRLGFYNQWNTDRGGALEENELYSGLYSAWDRNGDARLSEAEWGDTWFAKEYEFGAWDTDNDDVLTQQEWGAGFAGAGLFNTWDENRDGVLAENELYAGFHGVYDVNNDGMLAENEWGTFENAGWMNAGLTGGAGASGMTNMALTPEMMGVSLELIRNAEVVGAAGEEIGEVQELVRYPEGGTTAVGTMNRIEPRLDPVDTAAESVQADSVQTGAIGRPAAGGGNALGQGQGIYAVVNVDNGWFSEDRQFVVPISRFTVVQDGQLMLSEVTAEAFEAEFEEYEGAEWRAVDYDRYGTFGEAYEGYGWGAS